MRKSIIAVAVAAIFLVGNPLASGASAAPLSQTLVCGSSPIGSATAVQALLNRFHNAAWGGADGALGTRLPDGRTLLTFGDTFQDPTGLNPDGSRKANYRFRNNSMMFIGVSCLGALTATNF